MPLASSGSHTLRLSAPAKLNLFLHITGRRADGYHELQTLFQLLDYGDTIRLRRRSDTKIRLLSPFPGLPEYRHLAVRAARLLQDISAVSLGCDIHVTKRLPAGGGVGGGSSDAATTLLGLNALWGTGLDHATLQTLGRKLGADVPVFIAGNTAWAEGVGEKLTAVSRGTRYYLVLCPPTRIHTADLFAHPDLTRNKKPATLANFPGANFENVFQELVVASSPDIGRALRDLRAQPTSVHVAMTGTGSCVFAEFATVADRNTASAKLRHWRQFSALGVDRSSVFAELARQGF